MQKQLLIAIGAIVAVLVPLTIGVGVAIEAAPWERSDGVPLINTATPISTRPPALNVTPPADRHLCDEIDDGCVDLTGTEFCGDYEMCIDTIEVDFENQAELQAFQARYLAWLRSFPECPPDYDSTRPEFAEEACTHRVNPKKGPAAPPRGSEPLEPPAPPLPQNVPGGKLPSEAE